MVAWAVLGVVRALVLCEGRESFLCGGRRFGHVWQFNHGDLQLLVCWGLEVELGSRMTAKAGDLYVAGTEILFGD